MKITEKELVAIAESAREKAYSPYSDFCVGAALLCADGSVYEGCNIENASFTPTCCAERVAIFGAVANGKRDFEAIAIVGGKHGATDRDFCYPCGVCRQVMSEFCDGDFKIILANSKGEICVTTLDGELPHRFKLEKEENNEKAD